MSIDPFRQAFAGTDWAKAPAATSAAAATPVGKRTGSTVQTTAVPSRPENPRDSEVLPTPEAKGDFLTFGDLIDTLNPLQHIPLVSAVYRHYTGDTQRPQGEILGGLLYGGLIGGAAAVASVLLHETTGIDPGESVMAMLTGDPPAGQDAPAATQMAAAPAPPSPAAPTALAAPTATPTGLAPTGLAPTARRPQPAPPAQVPAHGEARAASIAAANQSALDQLARDLAGGAQTTGPAPQQVAEAQPALRAAVLPGLPAGATPHPTRMPVRGAVADNSQAPRMVNGEHRGSSFARTTPQSTLPSAQASAQPAAARPPAGAALPAPPPAPPPSALGLPRAMAQGPARATPKPTVVIPGSIATRPGLQAGALPIRPLNGGGPEIKPLAAPAVNPLAAPAATDTAEAPPMDVIPALMMRNLDKYHALSRSPRAPLRPTTTGPTTTG
jgi:hypothetical protein